MDEKPEKFNPKAMGRINPGSDNHSQGTCAFVPFISKKTGMDAILEGVAAIRNPKET